jgi:hypothetical protein
MLACVLIIVLAACHYNGKLLYLPTNIRLK